MSNPVAILRFAGRVVAVLAVLAGMAFAVLDVGPSVELWIWVVYAGVALYVVATLAAAFAWPRGAEVANDELVRWSETRSCAFDYWVTLFVFLALLWAVRGGHIPAERAFSALGLPLGFAPVLYMIVAFLRGRAG